MSTYTSPTEFFKLAKELFQNFDDEENVINEGKGHLEHPEDLVILSDIAGANAAVNAIITTAKNPKNITIKWDGYPALIFGRDMKGRFSIMDKHMFNKKDMSGRNIHSPEQFIQYDKMRGVDRAELHGIVTNIWQGLEKASKGAKGYYWGDMLFGAPLKEQNGLYKFKANPNGIAYTVDVNSDVGNLITNKTAGIAVHQYIPPDALTTDQAEPLNGSIGQLKNNSNVAIIPSSMSIVPTIKLDQGLVNRAKSSIKQNGSAVKKLMTTAPQARNTFNMLFTTYINKKIVSGDLNNLANDFMNYFESRPMTPGMRQKLSDHINNNKQGIVGLFDIWSNIYNLKNQVVQQLAKQAEQSPVKGYLQSGQQSQEGFVSQGLKFVDRMGFSRQNLSGQR